MLSENSKQANLGGWREVWLRSGSRVLGRATVWDGVHELSGVSANVQRTFFHKFCRWFAKNYYDTFVHGPRTDEEIVKTISLYSRMGLPGTIGSTDGVHIR